MDLGTWILTLITGFLLSFVWREIKNKLIKQITIFDELKKYGLIRKQDPMENSMEKLETKLNLILEKISEIENIKTTLIRLENRINESLGYLEQIGSIKEDLNNIKGDLNTLKEKINVKEDVEEEEKVEESENEEAESLDSEENDIDDLLLQIKTRTEKEQKLDVLEYIIKTKPENYFENPKFFPTFQEEIRKKNLPKTQALIELLAIKKLPLLDNKAPLLQPIYKKLDIYLPMLKNLSFMIGNSITEEYLSKFVDVTFLIIMIGTHQEFRIPEVFGVQENFQIEEILKQFGM